MTFASAVTGEAAGGTAICEDIVPDGDNVNISNPWGTILCVYGYDDPVSGQWYRYQNPDSPYNEPTDGMSDAEWSESIGTQQIFLIRGQPTLVRVCYTLD